MCIFDNNMHVTISNKGKNVGGLVGLGFELITCRFVAYELIEPTALRCQRYFLQIHERIDTYQNM